MQVLRQISDFFVESNFFIPICNLWWKLKENDLEKNQALSFNIIMKSKMKENQIFLPVENFIQNMLSCN